MFSTAGSNFYFDSSGMLKFQGGQSATSVVYGSMYSNTASSNAQSKFSAEMKKAALEASGMSYSPSEGLSNDSKNSAKNNALKASGRLTAEDKKLIMSNNAEYQRMQMYRARIRAIQSRKPREFGEDAYDDFSMNLSALKGMSAASEKFTSYQDSRNISSGKRYFF